MTIPEEKVYMVLQRLPNNGQKVLCFGHRTTCCVEDMDEEPDWHEVKFSFRVLSYKLKDKMPQDLEGTVIENINVVERWNCGDGEPGDDHIIGVTKWKKLR